MTKADDSSPIAWSQAHLVGFAQMDDEHQTFVDGLRRLQTCSDVELAESFAHLVAVARGHFEAEDTWMRETDFPPRDCHIDEHAAVLSSLDEVARMVSQGDLDEGRRIATALADWFPGHVQHLDSALSHWMCKIRYGGKPVVLRRDIMPLFAGWLTRAADARHAPRATDHILRRGS